MKDQSALGGRTVNRQPPFNSARLAKVTSTKDYSKFSRIEVIFLDYSQPVPVWVMNDIDREPVVGDSVLIGYIDNRKDSPYLIGFQKNSSYSTNFISVQQDKIKLQLPVYDVGIKDGLAHKDVQSNLLDDSNQLKRAYIELDPDHALVSFPTDRVGKPATFTIDKNKVEASYPVGDELAYIRMNAEGFEFFHPTGSATFKLPKGDIKKG
ncbi:hypothetical protein [Paenibacillus nuruki]|uniref:hypothetical protein n=1 Tax=Paenibacillus nuruki TaxID=1886670 RepID=UPI00280579E4|nr:hypothetical protein [Paenibacillus nuruki]CAJ1315909.1 hypothetical protein AASFL403_11850 [Paenibacillus nuruki]